ncbi:HAMP domain-containing sensor histidine kinase [Halopenitus sp. POP-27]|uniref:sensor histidine kinase n=1 Tax=Halopenitus sp. POP-27 TaxID=2994425 RepID=UPI002468EA4E|nr:HAMP domain-containing sensor histidine kinase [Halopenitus sp. POP-27]
MVIPTWIRYRGFVVALIGFAITRFFVAEALVVDRSVPFLAVGLLPLVAGLSLTVYGVALAVGVFSRDYVAAVTRWCLLGTGGMALVVAITLVGSGGAEAISPSAEPALVANVLISGAVAGVVVGDRSAKHRRERERNRRQANRALFVIRLLRHEVINAATIVDGHADLLRETADPRPRSLQAIAAAAARIRSTVEEVASVAQPFETTRRMDLEAIVTDTLAAFERDHPDVTVQADLETAGADTEVVGDDRIRLAIDELLENALEHGATERVAVGIHDAPGTVAVSVSDDGPGLSTDQRDLLTAGKFPEYDDPSAGFGLQVVHLIVARYGGEIRVSADGIDGDGTTITLVFPRHSLPNPLVESVSVTFPNLRRAVVASLVAGLAMGLFFQATSGLLPVIGALYGVERPVVGWITHLFHSVVFGLLFAAGCSWSRLRRHARNPVSVGMVGLLWGLVLWLVAAGLIMPVWLSLVGLPSALPNLSTLGLVGHVLWGAVLGTTFWWLGTRSIGEFDRGDLPVERLR